MDVAEYRRKAEHYLTCARQMSEPIARATFIDIAAYWMQLAEWAEQKQRIMQQPQAMPPETSAA